MSRTITGRGSFICREMPHIEFACVKNKELCYFITQLPELHLITDFVNAAESAYFYHIPL